LRRTNYAAVSTVGLVIDDISSTVTLDGKLLDVTPVEFNLLKVLAATPNRLLSRQQLMDALYSDGRSVVDRTIDSHVKNLRRKLALVRPESDWIETVYGVGYRFRM
jgi:two-component system response regulator BaeR